MLKISPGTGRGGLDERSELLAVGPFRVHGTAFTNRDWTREPPEAAAAVQCFEENRKLGKGVLMRFRLPWHQLVAGVVARICGQLFPQA